MRIDIELVEGPEAGNPSYGIYQLRGDQLTICLAVVGVSRPKSLAKAADITRLVRMAAKRGASSIGKSWRDLANNGEQAPTDSEGSASQDIFADSWQESPSFGSKPSSGNSPNVSINKAYYLTRHQSWSIRWAQEEFLRRFEMFGQVRNSSFEDIFNFQRDVDRFNQFLSDQPVRAGQTARTYPFQVHTAEDSWRVEIPMPGVDPTHVTLEVAGNTIAVRVEQDSGRNDGAAQWEQTMTVPRILDLDGIRATHRHGMLVLTIPLRESVKPRRVQIDGVGADTKTQKQLTTA